MMLISVLMVPVIFCHPPGTIQPGGERRCFFRASHSGPCPFLGWAYTGRFMEEGLLFGTAVNLYFLWAIMLIMALHMILPVPMYALKFKNFRLRGNLIAYSAPCELW